MAREYLSFEGSEERSDEEVLARSVEEPGLFVILVRKYEAPFLRKATSIIKDEDEAEDIVQEAFTKIYLNAKRFRKQAGAAFSSWGYRILINTALTHYARKKRTGAHVAELDQELYRELPDLDLRQFERRELEDLLASVLTRMPASFARSLTAHFLEGKPQEEIAREEGVSVGAVKTRVHRAKKEFRKIYETLNKRG